MMANSGQDKHTPTILVVDDDPVSLSIVMEYLQECDFRVIISKDGASGLKRADHIHPDLILLDVRMPGIDGFEVCRRLKANEHTRDIPVIFLTVDTETEAKVKGFQVGGVDYITKPFQEQEMLARVNAHLNARKAQKELQKKNVQLEQEIAERQWASERLAGLNVCLSTFGIDYEENINRLTALCGELLGSACALYNRLDAGMLCSLGQWNTPPGYKPQDNPDGHICYDVIQQGDAEPHIIRNLPKTPYVHTDPNVQLYQLETYIGQAVKCGDEFVGSLCVIYQQDYEPSENDLRLLGIAASALGAEENRKRAEEEIKRLYEQTRRDAKTKATLLDEVNHRIGNNLAALTGILSFEQARTNVDQAIYQAVMTDLINRVLGLATVHRMLSAAQWSPLLLSELAEQLITLSLQSLAQDKQVTVQVSPSPVQVTAKQANNLALVLNELITNSVKYAWPERKNGRITVRVERQEKDNAPDVILVEFRDDGPGYPQDVLRLERYHVGWDLIQNLVGHGMRGEVTLRNDAGAVTIIRFPAQI